MINEPKYDSDYVTKSYVDRAVEDIGTNISDTEETINETISTINKTYGAAPPPPYYVGNLYVDGTNLYRCNTERLIGSFNANDWELATAYPTTSYVDSTYTKPSDFEVTGTVNVNGGRITAGSIQSAHYVADTTGMKINLDNDTIDSKNFKVDSAGIITATDAILEGSLTSNNVNITGGYLKIGSNFEVLNSGNLTCKSITISDGSISSTAITGGTLNIGNGSFTVQSDGSFVATKATITGDVNATSGTFTGTVYATGGTFTGAIKATSGSFTGTISSSTISGSNITGGTLTVGNNYGWGRLLVYNNPGYIVCGMSTNHPYVSALNVARNAGGIVFTTGNTYSDVGTAVTQLSALNSWLECSTGFQALGNITTTGTFKTIQSGTVYEGKTQYITYKGSNGTTNYYMQFRDGILTSSGVA